MYRNFREDEQDYQAEIPGTSSILSYPKKANNNNNNQSLVHDVWEYSHDANDSFLTPIINEKLKKNHSSQDCGMKLVFENISDIQGEGNQYHSLVQQSGSIRNNIYTNEYGLQGKIQTERQNKQKQKESKSDHAYQAEYNQLQRATGIQKQNRQNNQTSKQNCNEMMTTPINQFYYQNERKPPQMKINTYPDSCREEDILYHKRTSNFSLLIRQTKEMMSYVRMYWMQSEIQQLRGKIIKAEIQFRRIKIINRSHSGIKNQSEKKIEDETGQEKRALHEYGYFGRPVSKSPYAMPKKKIHSSSKSKIVSFSKTPKSNSSNIIKIESNITKQQQAYLQQKIRQQKQTQQSLRFKEENLNKKIQTYEKMHRNIRHRLNKSKERLLEKQVNSSLKNMNSNLANSKQIQQIQTEETVNKLLEACPTKIEHLSSKIDREIGYKQLLIDRRNIVKETLVKIKQHYSYRIQKLIQEINNFKKEVKAIESDIQQTAMRARNKLSINSQNNLKINQKSIGSRKMLTNILKNEHTSDQIIRSPEVIHSKSRRKILMRSPPNHPHLTITCGQLPPQSGSYNQIKKYNLRKVGSLQGLKHGKSYHETDEIFYTLIAKEEKTEIEGEEKKPNQYLLKHKGN